MDDERIERALLAGPPDEPTYVPSTTMPVAGRRGTVSPRARLAMPVGMVALTAIAVAAVLVLAVVRIPPTVVDPRPGGPSLLTDVRTQGRIRIAVTRESPQVAVPTVGFDGFDIDVARAVAERLGLTPELHVLSPQMIEDEPWADAWDLAIDSAASTPDRAARLVVGRPYYARPGAVVVRADSSVSDLADLDGTTLCVVAGGLASAWLDGTLDLIDGTATSPPRDITVTTAVDTDACLAELDRGAVAGFVADLAFDVDLGGPGNMRLLNDEPFRSVAAPAVDPQRPGSATLLEEVDRIVADLRADGTLRDLSERRFGGQDLTGSIR